MTNTDAIIEYDTGVVLDSAEIALLATIEIRMDGSDGCFLCGLCTELCPWDAPIIEDSIMVVRQERCRGCGVCVAACPKRAIDMRVYGTEELLDLIRYTLTANRTTEHPFKAYDVIRNVESGLLHLEGILSHRALDTDLEGMLHSLKRILERVLRTEARFKAYTIESK